MKKTGKKRLRSGILLLLLICGCILTANCKVTTVQAASTTTMKKAYQNYVKKNKRNIKGYAYANIGPSGKPVLLTVTDSRSRWGNENSYYMSCKIYYYVNGRVKYLGRCIGARPISLYRRGKQYYIGNGTSSDKTFECVKNNRIYATWYMNAKERQYKTRKSVYTAKGIRYTYYELSYSNYDKALKKYKEIKMIHFSSVNYSETKPTFTVSCGGTGSRDLTMKVKCSKGGKLTWKSSNESVATVNSNGVITARKNGQATITARVKYNNKTYSVSRKVTVNSRKEYGSWSSWSLNPAYSNSYQQVRTTTLYRYYCFLCPVCGGREPLQGMSDCHNYRLTLNNGVVAWFTTPYSAANSAPYSYASYKRYTFSLGDGQRWNFSTGNINDHAVGTKDTDSAATVISTGYSTRSINTSYYVSSVN